jgi:hypothetical protein
LFLDSLDPDIEQRVSIERGLSSDRSDVAVTPGRAIEAE